ncbi:MAG: hypothetical protein QGF90_05895 [Gammaproteobacteria bacterium]|nr:hypothetical protein [Gammaproteobacteria bacterium]
MDYRESDLLDPHSSKFGTGRRSGGALYRRGGQQSENCGEDNIAINQFAANVDALVLMEADPPLALGEICHPVDHHFDNSK